MPDSIFPEGSEEQPVVLYFFVLPSDKPLGKNEADFSNVAIRKHVNNETQPCEPGEVFIVPKGKLGSLPLGLLHMADVQPRMQREDVIEKSIEATSSHMTRKRTVGIPTNQAVEIQWTFGYNDLQEQFNS